ncbi:F-box/LRR-repeat protein 4-like isoform X2 [Amphiura filiformis]
MKDSTLWKTINLWDNSLQVAANDTSQGPPPQSTWSFARNEIQVLKFLETYVGLALRRIYLHTVNDDILNCLCSKCPDLQFMSFTSAFSLLSSKVPSDVDLSLLPTNVEEIVLSVQRGRKRGRKLARGARVGRFVIHPLPKLRCITMGDILFDFELFRRISCCENLRTLYLTNCYDITEDGFILLTTRVPEIEDIRLENCRYGYHTQSTSEITKELTGILQTICKKLTQLKKFFLVSYTKISYLPLNEFLGRLGNFQTLRCVGFHGVKGFTLTGFEDIIKSLVLLEELVMSQSEDVTDKFLQIIAKYLRHLRNLQVPVAGNITDTGIQYFTHHPCLNKVNFAFCRRVSGQAMYDTFLTLPKLQEVIMSSRSDKYLGVFVEKIRKDMPNVTIFEL